MPFVAPAGIPYSSRLLAKKVHYLQSLVLRSLITPTLPRQGKMTQGRGNLYPAVGRYRLMMTGLLVSPTATAKTSLPQLHLFCTNVTHKLLTFNLDRLVRKTIQGSFSNLTYAQKSLKIVIRKSCAPYSCSFQKPYKLLF